MSRSRLAIALGVVPLLVVGGCSEDSSGPRVAPRETSAAPTVSPSASPTGPVEPTMPAAARKNSPAGAEAFVEYYWDVANYAQATGDAAALEELSTKTCRGCQGAIGFLRGVYRRGGTIKGGEATLSDLVAERLMSAGRPLFRITFTISNTRQVVDEPGSKEDKVFPAASVTDRFVLNRVDGGWRVGVWEVLT